MNYFHSFWPGIGYSPLKASLRYSLHHQSSDEAIWLSWNGIAMLVLGNIRRNGMS